MYYKLCNVDSVLFIYQVCAPIALFLVNKKQQLVPIAIQLNQQKAENNPVITMILFIRKKLCTLN